MFDFDGVLADSERVHQWAWNQTLEPAGIHLDWDYYQKNFVGIPDEVAVRERLHLKDAEALVEQKQALFRQGMADGQVFLPETVQLLEWLRNNYKLAVVSSSYKSEVEPPLIRCGIRDYFQLLVTGEDVQNFKPSPEPYLLAAERLGAKRPLVIEDSEAGVASGRAAGFEVLRVSAVENVGREVRERVSTAEAGAGPDHR